MIPRNSVVPVWALPIDLGPRPSLALSMVRLNVQCFYHVCGVSLFCECQCVVVEFGARCVALLLDISQSCYNFQSIVNLFVIFLLIHPG